MRKLNKRSRLVENTIEAYSGAGCPCDAGVCFCDCTGCSSTDPAGRSQLLGNSNSNHQVKLYVQQTYSHD